jgi:hypothetical protein
MIALIISCMITAVQPCENKRIKEFVLIEAGEVLNNSL